jgi:putative SOS response-associated peptidase YedK
VQVDSSPERPGQTGNTWLKGTADEAFVSLKQYPDAHLVATPVSTRVNAPKNNDAKLIEPLAA